MPTQPTANWDFVEVRGRYVGTDGKPVSGRVTFTPKASRMVDLLALTTIIGRTISAEIDPNDGTFAISLPASDDPDITPASFTYTVDEDFRGGDKYEIEVPISSQVTGIELASIAPTSPNSGSLLSPVTRLEFNSLASRIGEIELNGGGSGGGGVSDYEDLTNKPNFAAVATSGSYADLADKPDIPALPTLAPVATSGAYGDLSGTPEIPVLPSLSEVATSGSYADLADKPSIPVLPALAAVATSGAYGDLTGTPEIPEPIDTSAFATTADLDTRAYDLGYANVRQFGATGDGSTDDTAAIQATLDSLTAGGVCYFPPGAYMVSAPLSPTSQTTLMGTHTPRYQSTATAASNCKIELLPTFSGAAMIEPGLDVRGISLNGICLSGAEVGVGIHGIFQDGNDSAGEFGWLLMNSQISGFTGSGYMGSSHVATWFNVHINHNHGYGILSTTEGSQRFVDTKMMNCFGYFNRQGGIRIDCQNAGFLDMVNVRWERSGGNSANVAAPFNTEAHGMEFNRMSNSSFTNVSTDANTGCGLSIKHTAAGQGGTVTHLNFTSCIFKRDGYGDFVNDPNLAGVRLQGYGNQGADSVQHLSFSNCRIIVGKPGDDDTGNVSPANGLWIENTQYIAWDGSVAQTANQRYYFGQAGEESNWKPRYSDVESMLMTMPSGNELPTAPPNGAFFYDLDRGLLLTYFYGNWYGPDGATVV